METALSAETDIAGGDGQVAGGKESTGKRAEDGGVAGCALRLAWPASVWEFGALKMLTRMLGRTAAVECFSTSSCYLCEGTLMPTHMENLVTSAELQGFAKVQHGPGLSGEQCVLRATDEVRTKGLMGTFQGHCHLCNQAPGPASDGLMDG